MMTRCLFIIAMLLSSLVAHAEGDGIVADVSSYYVAISPQFQGTKVLLYGAVDYDNADVILIIKGPRQNFALDKKERNLGLWLKGKTVLFNDMPHFYHVISSDEVKKIATPSAVETYNLSLAAVLRSVQETQQVTIDKEDNQAYLENMQKAGLYAQSLEPFSWLGKRLFRVELNFPVNVSTGTYILEAYHLRDGYVESAQSLPLFIRKSGFLGFLFAFAHNFGYFYGIVAIILASLAGFLAYWALRKN